jgi:predicted enzyme related to lactoylglutathione lyase
VDCSSGVIPLSIWTSTERTAAVAFSRLRRPRGVSCVGSTLPTRASTGRAPEELPIPVTGPDFISLQVRDLDASQAFYEQYLGLVLSPAGPPHAVVFETSPIAFALRDVVPGTDLASVAQPGIGAAIWLHATDVQTIHDTLVDDGHLIISAPMDGPFGRTFTLSDPDGYHVTLHDRV